MATGFRSGWIAVSRVVEIKKAAARGGKGYWVRCVSDDVKFLRANFFGEVWMELNESGREVVALTVEERAEEQKLIRRLQMMMNMVMQVIAQDASLTVDEAAQMIADSRKAELAMFPGKELAYDLIWKPRFQRLMRERFRIM